MFQSPVMQAQLARERDRCADIERRGHHMQVDPPPTESMLDTLVRRLKQLVGHRPSNPLAAHPDQTASELSGRALPIPNRFEQVYTP